LVQGQGIQPLAATTVPALLAQGLLQQPGNVNQYQPDVLLARLGFVGLLQADPNARFSLPRLLTGGGGEQTPPADQELINRINSVILVHASPTPSDETQGSEEVPMPTVTSDLSARAHAIDEVMLSETP
jgi:hypothetical protein